MTESLAKVVALQIKLHTLFRKAHCPRQRNLREIVRVQAGNVIRVRRGHGFLRLHDFEIVRDARIESILRLLQRLIGQVDRTSRDFNLFRGRLQIQHRGSHVGIDLRPKTVQLLPTLLERSVRLQHVAVNFSTLEYGNIQGRAHLKYAV